MVFFLLTDHQTDLSTEEDEEHQNNEDYLKTIIKPIWASWTPFECIEVSLLFLFIFFIDLI